VKPDKMKKIVWPEAQGLIAKLLEEKVEDRPKSWDEVISHPFLDTDNSAALAALMNKMDSLQAGQSRAEKKLDVIGSDVKEVKQHVSRVLVGLKAVQDTIVNLDASPIPTVFVVEPQPTLRRVDPRAGQGGRDRRGARSSERHVQQVQERLRCQQPNGGGAVGD